MDFSAALLCVKLGKRIARKGWNGKNMFLVFVPGSTITVEPGRPLGEAAPELIGQAVTYLDHIDMFTAQGEMVPWLASQTDILAEDWECVS